MLRASAIAVAPIPCPFIFAYPRDVYRGRPALVDAFRFGLRDTLSSWRSFRKFVSNSANTPSMSRKHLPAAVAYFFYKYEIMSDTELTTLEQDLLLAVIALHPHAYGVSIQDHIKERTGREPLTGGIYASLDRLEEKGFVKSRQGEPTKERGGKRKLYFTITAPGQHTLSQSLLQRENLRLQSMVARTDADTCH